jgi:predicted nucleic acid-binding protein
MSCVVDASVIVAALVDTAAEGGWAESIIAAGPLYAPALLGVEATSALRRLELARRITTAEANAAQVDLGRLAIELLPFEPFADRVWELRRQVKSYDAWYVAVAEALHLPLATLDRRLARVAGVACEFRLPVRP